MEVNLVENIEAQLESSQTGSALDLSLIGKGKEFRKLRTYTASLFILLMVVCQCTITVLVVVGIIDFKISIAPIKSVHFLPFHFLLVLQSFFWLITAILDRIMHHLSSKHKHHGYVSFYTGTKFLRRLPGYIMSTGCASSLLVAGLWGDYSPDGKKITPQLFMMIISLVQTAIIIPVMFYYATTVIKFNKSRILPDMERYLKESASPIQIQVGLSRSQQELEITIDKQAEIIQSLQHHNQVLARRIMSLHKQIKA
ncbi:hypothetical protein ACHWQZ_G001384 [Mnemiopsis leidyi]